MYTRKSNDCLVKTSYKSTLNEYLCHPHQLQLKLIKILLLVTKHKVLVQMQENNLKEVSIQAEAGKVDICLLYKIAATASLSSSCLWSAKLRLFASKHRL